MAAKSDKPRIAVIGAGPAGLSTASHLVRLLGKSVQIELFHMGHHHGGKAASWQDPKGNEVEHGFHICFGFYQEMFKLMRMAGVKPENVLKSTQNKFYFIDTPRQGDKSRYWIRGFKRSDNYLRFAASLYRANLMPFFDQANLGRFLAYCLMLINSGEGIWNYDDRCFTAFALENGLKERTTHNSSFRFFRQAYFNWPDEISAYHVLRSLEYFQRAHNSEMFNFTKPLSEGIWDVIANHLKKENVKITPYKKLTALNAELTNRRGHVKSIVLTRPDARMHKQKQNWQSHVLEDHTTDEIHSFDYIISTVPVEVFKHIKVNDKLVTKLDPLCGIKELRSQETINLMIETREPISKRYLPTMAGLNGPLHSITDMKPITTRYRNDDSIGSMINICGQPGEYKKWSNQKIVRATMLEIARLPGVKPIKDWHIKRIEVHRNSSRHERLFQGDPGIHKFRPQTETYFDNFFFAGDWVQNGVDIICMEAAITSGKLAAQKIAQKLGATE